MHVVVVGGGVAGLSAAAEACRRGARVTVLEGSSRVGGKVAVSEVGGLPVDEGADSMLTRVPDGLALAREAGIGLVGFTRPDRCVVYAGDDRVGV